jgi:hypothetical protein
MKKNKEKQRNMDYILYIIDNKNSVSHTMIRKHIFMSLNGVPQWWLEWFLKGIPKEDQCLLISQKPKELSHRIHQALLTTSPIEKQKSSLLLFKKLTRENISL